MAGEPQPMACHGHHHCLLSLPDLAIAIIIGISKATGLVSTPETLPMLACVVITTCVLCFVSFAYCLKVWDACMFEGVD